MRMEIVELEHEDKLEYQRLRARDEVHDRMPQSLSMEEATQLQMDIAEFEFYILEKYGDQEHRQGNWAIDAVQGILYVDD